MMSCSPDGRALTVEWLKSLDGLHPDDHGGDAPDIMLRRVWGFSDEQDAVHAHLNNQDFFGLQSRVPSSLEDVVAFVENSVADDLETLRHDPETQTLMRSAPEGLAYRIWIDNSQRDPDEQPRSTVFAFEQGQLADFADTAMPGKAMLAKAWRDSTTITSVAAVCRPWFARSTQQSQQMEMF